MTPEEFLNRHLPHKLQQLQQYVRQQAPRIVGQMAVNHVRNDFRSGGLTHNGFHRWPETRRQRSGSVKASAQYGPLLSGRNHLMSSITAQPGEGKVRIYTDVEYAAIHNNGGTVHPRITPRMRKFAWAMYYRETGERPKGRRGKRRKNQPKPVSEEARRWKALALTRKQRLDIRIPQRQFLPPSISPELKKRIDGRLEKDIVQILQS